MHGKDWANINDGAVQKVLGRIRERIDTIINQPGRYIPLEDPAAEQIRRTFFTWLEDQPLRYVGRLNDHFKRDLLLRAIFSSTPEIRITAELAERSVVWTKRQLEDRIKLWPEDVGSQVEILERRIVDALKHHRLEGFASRGIAGLSDREIAKFVNVHKPGSGGFETLNRAKKALLMGHEIKQAGMTRKQMPIYDIA
jgi:hypothetical protein